ncbi:tetratricopeptide repeat protein [Castellaniella sp.]|uniref:tetratricopeptide repeat protein n=1 Tax=Castellaniella sp. TaxID=1955812 RepID=UPI003566FD2A
MRFPTFVLAVLLALGAARGGAWAASPETGAQARDDTAQVHPGEPPRVELTAELLYRLLVAEFSAQHGLYDDASQALLALSRDTQDSRLALRSFQMAMSAHNLALALRAARQWAELDPDNPEAVAASLALSASSGQTDGLARTLARRIASADDRDQAIVQAAGIVARMTDKRLALDVLDKALASVVNVSSLAHLALADAAWAAGDGPRALAEARRGQQLDPDSQDAAQRVLEYGLRLQPDDVIRETQAFIDEHPGQRGLELLLVSRLTSQGRFDEALALLARMRRQAPEDFDLLYTEAEVNARAERYAQARILLDQYIAIQQQRRTALDDRATSAQADVADARLLLVRIAEREQDHREAIRQLRLIDDPALTFQARTHEAVLYGKLGDLAQARATLDTIEPEDRRERVTIRLTLAAIYKDAGRTDQAVELLKAADLEMPDTPEIKYDLGMMLLHQGKVREFETLMRRIIELDPDNANAYNSLGYTLVEQNRALDEARDLLERALDLDPDSPYILDSVGWYLYRIQDYEGALEYLHRSYAQMPAADVAAHLGEVLWLLGRQAEARDVWSGALRREPEAPAILETLERLKVPPP